MSFRKISKRVPVGSSLGWLLERKRSPNEDASPGSYQLIYRDVREPDPKTNRINFRTRF